MGTQPIALVLIVAGAALLAVGLLLYFAGAGPFSWIGRLPGDIRIGSGNVKFYFPIMTSIIVSIILTLLIFIIGRLR